jgi:predicted nucleotidyltransferase
VYEILYDKIQIMNTKNEILHFLQNNKELLLSRFHVQRIGLFGSFAREEQNSNSDVDLIVELEDGTENDHELKHALKEFLSSAFQRSVDIAREKYLKSYAKEQVLKEAVYV